MLIKVDVREAELIKIFENLIATIPIFKELKMQTESLPLGDIIIYDDDKNADLLIIERKSISDLLSSIKDGRYEEQSYRLGGSSHPNHNIMYIIEGDVNSQHNFKGNYFKNKFNNNNNNTNTNTSSSNALEKLTAYSAMFSLNYYKGFSVFRTFNMSETATYICNTANKIRKSLLENKTPYYSVSKVDENDVDNKCCSDNKNGSENEDSCKDYVGVIKKIKKDNITPENIGEIMLCQIPGISSLTAIAIMKKSNTISNLIQMIQTDETCLKDVATINSKGQSRKISKTCVANIIKFLK
jgi:ERCC4-type nuclease